MTTAVYLPRAIHSQDEIFEKRPHSYDSSTACAHHRNLDHEEAPYQTYQSSSQGRSQRGSQQENRHGGSHHRSSQDSQRYPHCPTWSNGGGRGGDSYSLPKDNGYYPNLLLLDVMVIMVHPKVVMVVLWMIFIKLLKKVPHSLSQSQGKDKIDKISILYKANLKKYDKYEWFTSRLLHFSNKCKVMWLMHNRVLSNHKKIIQMAHWFMIYQFLIEHPGTFQLDT